MKIFESIRVSFREYFKILKLWRSKRVWQRFGKTDNVKIVDKVLQDIQVNFTFQSSNIYE